jgi:aminoglycoside 6'-N-acetyltransferase I
MKHMGIKIQRCFSVEASNWLALRQALWPHCTPEEHLSEMEAWCANPARYAVFLASTQSGHVIGFAEAAIRKEYVNGTDTSPVGFLEGVYVTAEFRQRGVARALVTAVEVWVAGAGYQELASDTEIENKLSQEMHQALGFEETERIVFFRKRLVKPGLSNTEK